MRLFILSSLFLFFFPVNAILAGPALLVGGTELSNVTDQIHNCEEGKLLISQGVDLVPAFITPTAGTGLSLTSNATTLQYALSTPVSVVNGGTGTTSLTSNGLLIGAGTSAITPLAVGATNTVLLGNTGASPSFGQVPNAALANSSVTVNNGNNITVTGSPLSLGGSASIALSGTTDHAVQVGNGSGSLTSLGVGINGQILVGSTGADPSFVTPTAGTGLSLTSNATTLQYTLSTPVSVVNGGSGVSSLTAYSLIAGGTTSTNPMQSLVNVGIAGQVLTSNGAGALPTWQTSALSTPVSVANGGTGLAATTAYAVLCGGTTNTAPLQSIISVGTAGQVLTSNGVDELPSFQTGVQTATVTLTSAQVKALRASPVTIIPAPGANKIINVLGCLVKLKYGGTNAFTAQGSQTLRLGYSGTNGTVIVNTALAKTSIEATTNRVAFSGVTATTGFADTGATLATNSAVVIYNSVATEITGNAANNNTIVVSVTYQIVDVS